MTPLSLAILNCVADAQSFLYHFKNSLGEWRLASTHGAVNDYLNTQGVSCLELSSVLSDDFIVAAAREADSLMSSLLSALDRSSAHDISSRLRVCEMNYFMPLYQYLGIYECLAILKIEKALQLLVNEEKYHQLLVYQSVNTSYFDGDNVLVGMARHISGKHNISITIKDNIKCVAKAPIKSNWVNLRRVLSEPYTTFLKLKDIITRRLPQRVVKGKKNILVIGPLFDLAFFNMEIFDSNVIFWPRDGFPKLYPLDTRVDAGMLAGIAGLISAMKERYQNGPAPFVVRLMTQNVLKDFCRKIPRNLGPLVVLDRLHRQRGIDLAVWGCAPVHGSLPLMVEYLLKSGVQVLGTQHGGCYAVQDCARKHFLSDLQRCTHFLSYGFEEADLNHTYPGSLVPCKVIPVGSYRVNKLKKNLNKNSNREKIDIFYPLTNNLSIFFEAYRINASKLRFYQTEILNTLDQLTGLRIVVKPLPNYSEKDCSVIEILKRLQHVKVVDHLTVTSFLRKYETQAVVIDFPSTPLYEVIGEGLDIFLMSDPILPFSNEVLALLKKRVHYFEKIQDLTAALEKYQNGDLPKLRDCGFYNKHVYREDTRELIINTINKLLHKQL